MTRTILTSLLLVAACSSSQPAATPAAPVVTLSAPEPVLAITELKFYDGDKLGMELHADGTLSMLARRSGEPPVATWRTVGTIAADGSVKPTTPGKPGGKLGADGRFTSPDGQAAPFTLEADALVAGDKRITLGGDGVVAINGETASPPMRVEGATDAKSRKTALLVLAMMMTSGHSVTVESGSVESVPATVTP